MLASLIEAQWCGAVLANLPSQILLVVDKDLRYRMVGGEQMLALFNLTKGELLGSTVLEVLGEHVDSVVLASYRAALQGTHSTFLRTYRGIRFEQTMFPLYSPVSYGPIGACSIVSERVNDGSGSNAVAGDEEGQIVQHDGSSGDNRPGST